MSLAGTYTETPAIFLQPRPLARTPGRFVLLPLLPRPRPVKPLPEEVWSKVLSYVIDDGADCMGLPEKRACFKKKWELLFVCKPWVVSVIYIYLRPTEPKGSEWRVRFRLTPLPLTLLIILFH